MMSRQPAAAVATLLRTPDANRDNATPFLLACLSGNQSMCEYLFELGGDIRAKSSRFAPRPRVFATDVPHYTSAADVCVPAAALLCTMPCKATTAMCCSG